ncbi:MAG: riboflavin biosynthesis protein RibF [Alphaproteobacteria bacterium]|nr:riboflavin biosynthesis protein RibF [Alphaproteobacteria bacterium]
MEQVWGASGYAGEGGVVTIGNFDGVHLGHRALLDRARALDRGPVLAYTFHPAPRDVLRPDNGIQRIQRLEDRVATLLEAGADTVVVEPFDLAFAALSPEDFAHGILRDRLRATAVVVGWDFRFGRGRQGTAEGLAELLEVPVEQVAAVEHGGEPVSSSRIRELLLAGDVAAAAVLLARPHAIVGTVVRGDARGRELGFPTANLDVTTPLVPADGVYAVTCDGRPAVANLGARPTFAGASRSVEVHVLDFDGDLYGREVTVAFHARIRGERAFAGRDALVARIAEDIAEARVLLGA